MSILISDLYNYMIPASDETTAATQDEVTTEGPTGTQGRCFYEAMCVLGMCVGVCGCVNVGVIVIEGMCVFMLLSACVWEGGRGRDGEREREGGEGEGVY